MFVLKSSARKLIKNWQATDLTSNKKICYTISCLKSDISTYVNVPAVCYNLFSCADGIYSPWSLDITLLSILRSGSPCFYRQTVINRCEACVCLYILESV